MRFHHKVEILKLKQSQNEQLLDRLTSEKLKLTEMLLRTDGTGTAPSEFDMDLQKELHLITKTTTRSEEDLFKKVDKIVEVTFQKKSLKSIEDSFLRHEKEVQTRHRLSRQTDETPNVLGGLTRNRAHVPEPNRKVFFGPN